ncbi:MAG: hypothetical protein ACRCXL_12030 [Dermatophilaceae bacterium]
MAYFFSKTWLWWLLAAVLAGIIAWLLCRFAGRGTAIAAATAAEEQRRHLVDARERVERHGATISELKDQLRDRDTTATQHTSRITELESQVGDRDTTITGHTTRIADLEGAATERDTLRTRVAALENELRDRDTAITGHTTRIADLEGAATERDTLRSRVAALENELRARPAPTLAVAAPQPTTAEPAGSAPENGPDVAAGSAALGFSLTTDDLTAVEGIGPKIRDLIHATGVRTWRALSRTDVGALQEMLDAAGPRFRVHSPETWPRQAGLLADGRWKEFKELTSSLRGGRTV